MLTDINGHLIDKTKVIYVSPVRTFRTFSFGFYEVGVLFTVRLVTGDEITVSDTLYPETREEFRQALKEQVTPMYNKMEEERKKLL